MRQLTTALKSSKIATLIAVSVLAGYMATLHNQGQPGGALSEFQTKPAGNFGRDLTDETKLARLGVPLPMQKPGGLPKVTQPFQITVVSLKDSLTAHEFDLNAIREGASVPRYFVEHLPSDILEIENVRLRKQVFLSVTLPLVLKVNENIRSNRQQLVKLIDKEATGKPLTTAEQVWLEKIANRYDSSADNLENLLLHMDAIPVSLALAQSIEESGWGTSRFARNGNALFGQRVWSAGHGLVPHERDTDESYEVRAFQRLEQSIRSYALNLNRHPAYDEFRQQRAQLREENEALDGLKLADTLTPYSERGEDYVMALQPLIEANNLTDFDLVRLSPERVAQIFSPSSN